MSVGHEVLYDVDWTTVSTVMLTVITGYYAWHTRKMLLASARQAAAAERTVELLVEERNRQLRQLQAPIYSAISTGRKIVKEWCELNLDTLRASKAWRNSRELELRDLPELVMQARSLYFPLSQALASVEQAIIVARSAIDALSATTDDVSFASSRASVAKALEDLAEAWMTAERALNSWQ